MKAVISTFFVVFVPMVGLANAEVEPKTFTVEQVLGCGEIDSIRNDACIYSGKFDTGATSTVMVFLPVEELAVGEVLTIEKDFGCGEIDGIRNDSCVYQARTQAGDTIEIYSMN